MKLHELVPAKGNRKTRKRVGRGQGAGQGKTSGRGQKGQGSRSSVGLPRGFEGGQMPLKQRLPKLRGFHNRWRREYVVVNLGKLVRFDKDTVVDADVLTEAGLIPRASSPVKVLAAGHLSHALTLRVRSDLGCSAHRRRIGRRLGRAARPSASGRRSSTRWASEPSAELPRVAARAELLSRPKTPAPLRLKPPDGKKGTGSAPATKARPAKARKRRKASEASTCEATSAPDSRAGAPQDNEAVTEDTE